MNARLQKFVAQFDRHELDACLVTSDVNISYLSRFSASESWLLVLPRKAYYITDFRYILEARQGLKGVTVVRYEKSMAAAVLDLARRHNIRRLGFDDRHLSLAQFKTLKSAVSPGVRLVSVRGIVEFLREIKEKEELALIRKALALNLEAYRFLKGVIRPGVTEKRVLESLERYVKARKAGFSFPPIIASGPNSCYPHARVTDRKVKNNEPVLVDMGMDIKGYKSDLTRMFFLGKIPPLIRKVNDFVAEAQARAIKAIRPGKKAGEIDETARNFLREKRLAKYFGHSLGHGVGAEIHEDPRVSPRSPVILKPGMVFTVEPAVYLPHQFGIRIEDMVLVTPGGCEILSRKAG
ncbi:MAG: Xaa-Pro peptidase family protein [Candidatus Omnitrophota bacterium]|nr:Xaa-Pro peptidase family protein [Candidatus Omnitrophota bacterium]MDZ4241751.1 Xaa-Pro peptidase family protein [Candidatus Omnitrophota bacterium]